MSTLTGEQLVGQEKMVTQDSIFAAINPKTGMPLPTMFHEATALEVDKAVQLAEKAFPIYKQKSPTEIADFLEQIAEEILNLGETLIERAMLETALPQGRLQGERGRTMNQLKLFAEVVREGSWVDARIDRAIPDRQPAPCSERDETCGQAWLGRMGDNPLRAGHRGDLRRRRSVWRRSG